MANFLRRYDLAKIKRRGKFLLKDAGFNAIYAPDLGAMQKLARLVGDEASVYAARRRRVVQSMRELMYDGADCAFYDLKKPGSKEIRVRTPHHLLSPRARGDPEDEFAAPLPILRSNCATRRFMPERASSSGAGPPGHSSTGSSTTP